jgi:hypothetical protein
MAYCLGWKEQHYKYLIGLRTFLEYIQRAQYPEAEDNIEHPTSAEYIPVIILLRASVPLKMIVLIF